MSALSELIEAAPPVLFRYHRGDLAESLKTAVEVEDSEHLVHLVFRVYGPGELEVSPYCDDTRPGMETWLKTYAVTWKNAIVGFTNGLPATAHEQRAISFLPFLGFVKEHGLPMRGFIQGLIRRREEDRMFVTGLLPNGKEFAAWIMKDQIESLKPDSK